MENSATFKDTTQSKEVVPLVCDFSSAELCPGL